MTAPFVPMAEIRRGGILESVHQGVAVVAEREFLRNHILQAILAWDKENDRITEAVKAKIAAKSRRVVEGTREWDLLVAEEMERAYAAFLSRGE